MINTIKHRMGKEQEEGFTLIELMVVVLILGILMAIAIPTFLSLTSSAKTNAAESDLTVATQDEAVYYTQNGSYDVTSGGPTAANNVADMQAIDSGLNWTTTAPTAATAGTKSVTVAMPTAYTTASGATGTVAAGTDVLLSTASSNGSFYWVNDYEGFLTYYKTASATAPTLIYSAANNWKAIG